MKVNGKLLSTLAALIVTLITFASIYYIQTTLRKIEVALPVKIADQKIDINHLNQRLSDLVQALRVHALLPAHRDEVVSEIAGLRNTLQQIQRTYEFDTLLGVTTFHALISPAVQDIDSWLNEGISGFGPESREVLGLSLARAEETLQQAWSMTEQADQKSVDILDEQARELRHFRQVVTALLGLLMILAMMLVFYIYKQQRSNHLLRTSSRRFRDFASIASDYLWETDSAQRFSFLSDSYEDLTGVPASRLIGKTTLELVDGEQEGVGIPLDHVDAVNHCQPVDNAVLNWTQPDGEQKRLSITGRPVYDDTGNYQGYRGCVNDITALSMATERAEQMRLLAEEANRAKTEFLSNISHEIRTPITIITGMADRLRNESALSREERQRTLDTIENSSESLLMLIDQILDVSKIESGYFELILVETNLRKLLDDLYDGFRQNARDRNIELRTEIDQALRDSYRGDAFRIEQILRNLIVNALKAPQSDIVTVRAGLESRDSTRDTVLFSVADNGQGISEEDQQHIFEPFTQLGVKRQVESGGAGLGLSICKKLVTRMKGKIWVESRIGYGSIFYFSVPLYESSAGAADVHSARTSEPAIAAPLSILIAEDDEIVQGLIQSFFTGPGHQLMVANNGREAIDMFTNNAVDLILMDLRMPEMDGFEATRIIRSIERGRPGKPIPIIALSASVMTHDIEKCLDAGFTDHVSKPVRKHALLDLVAGMV